MYAGANMGHPSCFRRGYRHNGEETFRSVVSHIAKNERDAPTFLYAALDMAACAPFFKGKAHEVRGTHQAPQEIGGMGHPGAVAETELKGATLREYGYVH
jgi:hypothetical protein